VLRNLETHELTPNEQSEGVRPATVNIRKQQRQLNLFVPLENSKVHDEIQKLNINEITPVDALNTLDHLKKLLAEEEKKKSNQ